MDPAERLERLEGAGVDVVIVEHFDEALRQTPYDAFVGGIADRCAIAGFLMTPDAAFGHDRAGTATTVGELGRRDGFEVVVVPPFALDGREVRSSDIRAAIASGDLATAERLLGRPYAVVGDMDASGAMTFAMPVALPPPGAYGAVLTDGRAVNVTIEDGSVQATGAPPATDVRLELGARP
jgi:riboflavin kinase/FMN adenylyltransferase